MEEENDATATASEEFGVFDKDEEEDIKPKYYKMPEEELPILNLKKTIEVYSQTSRFLKKRKHQEMED